MTTSLNTISTCSPSQHFQRIEAVGGDFDLATFFEQEITQ
jgi:hypothetical protein